MKYVENLMLQVKVLDDGAIQVRRTDGRQVTLQDRKEARRLADSSPGITVADALRIFPGAKVTK
jgi:hypothetical protein